jgi:hypothetical protein
MFNNLKAKGLATLTPALYALTGLTSLSIAVNGLEKAGEDLWVANEGHPLRPLLTSLKFADCC